MLCKAPENGLDPPVFHVLLYLALGQGDTATQTQEAQWLDAFFAELEGRPIIEGRSIHVPGKARGTYSRGRSMVDHFKTLRAVPFLVPAMGRHGGATPAAL